MGLDYMIEAGYNPMGAVRLQEKLLDDVNAVQVVSEVAPFLSTHPTSAERIDNMIDRVKEKGYYVPPKYLTMTVPSQSATPSNQTQQSPGSSEAEEAGDVE